MKARYLISFLRVASLLAMASCTSYEVTVREPLSLAPHSADRNVDDNMLAVSHIRMALPEGWFFKSKKKEDDKSVLFWMHDSGGNAVTGTFRYNHFNNPVSLTRAAEGYGNLVMTGFVDKELFGTSVDNHDAYLLRGKKEGLDFERASLLVADGPKDIHDITLIAESTYLKSNPEIANAIFSSYKIVPWDLSERRIKGTFSFRCDAGTPH